MLTVIVSWGLAELLETIHRGEGLSRIRFIDLQEKELYTPIYIVSYSSDADPKYIGRMWRILTVNMPANAFLISAYDYIQEIDAPKNNALIRAIRESSKTRLLILDSGAYEIRRKEDVSWDSDRVLNAALGLLPDIVVAYDPKPPSDVRLNLADGLAENISSMREALASAGADESLFLFTFVIRSNLLTDAAIQIDNIVDVIASNADLITVIGFPDVDIHANIADRLRFCAALRRALDDYSLDIPIHVFGCSELLSILSYSYCGAEMFDGSGWWRRTVDINCLEFVDESYLEFLDCECASCSGTEWKELSHSDYGDKLMLHNLLAFGQALSSIHQATEEGGYEDLFARSRLGRRLYDFVKEVCEIED